MRDEHAVHALSVLPFDLRDGKLVQQYPEDRGHNRGIPCEQIFLLDMAGIALAGACIMCLYNGERMESGRTFSKWFFYLFYPAHLTVLALLLSVSL